MYSHSKLSSYEQCPLKYRFAYIDKIKIEGRSSIEAYLGTRVHECLEHLYRDMQFEKKNTLIELLSFYDERWEAEWNDDIIINKKDYTRDNYHQMGRRFITDYYSRHHPFEDGRTILLEGKINISLDETEQPHIIGYIDRLVQRREGHYEVHDYKTNSSLPTQKDADQDRQLALYAIGVRQRFPDAINIDLIWHYLAFDKFIKSHRTEEELSELKEEIKLLISEIESCTDFPPKVTRLCDWCDYQAVCPEFSHLFLIKSLPPEELITEDGLQLVDRYWSLKEELRIKRQAIEAELTSLEEKIGKYAMQNNLNTIYGSQRKLKITESEDYKFPKKNSVDQMRLIDKLKENGLWDSVISLDNTALSKLLSSEEIPLDFKKTLDEMIPKEQKKSFRLSKFNDE